MTYLIEALGYTLIGLLIGFLTHLFYGIVESSIKFNKAYFYKLVFSFFKLLLVFGLVNLSILPFYSVIFQNEFSRQLVYYLLAFAGFDFTFHVVKPKID